MAFFNRDTYCGKSKLPEGLHHNTVKTYRCPGCNYRNPTFQERRLPSSAEVIPIPDDSPEHPPPRPIEPIPVKSSRAATHIPSIPGLIVGNADIERQRANQRQADRKTKTGVRATTPTIHFSIGVTRYTWNIISDDGDWSTAERGKNWSIDLANSELSSEGLLHNLLIELIKQNKRAEVAKWLTPAEEGDWAISHTNPMKHAIREIAPWTDARLLSEVIEQGAYELKSVGTKKLVQLWLCWQPEPPPAPSPGLLETPTPLRKVTIKKEKGVKKTVKQEMKAEPLSSAPSTPLVLPKRPRAISSETPIRKRGAVTRSLKALRATVEEDDDDEEQLEPLEKLLGISTSAGEVGNSEV
jgi:hypothetical protein